MVLFDHGCDSRWSDVSWQNSQNWNCSKLLIVPHKTALSTYFLAWQVSCHQCWPWHNTAEISTLSGDYRPPAQQFPRNLSLCLWALHHSSLLCSVPESKQHITIRSALKVSYTVLCVNAQFLFFFIYLYLQNFIYMFWYAEIKNN